MHVAPSKHKAASVSLCSPINVAGTEIADVFLMKILGYIFICDLDWKLQARAIRSKVSSKLCVYRCISGFLSTKTQSLICKTSKNRTSISAYRFGAIVAQNTLNWTIFSLNPIKCLITNNKTASILKSDFSDFSKASFCDLILVSVTCQFLRCIPMPSDFTPVLLKNIDKSMVTCASVSNKVLLTNSKRSCDNSFVY